MAGEPRVLDAQLAHLYALALVAVARADDQIGLRRACACSSGSTRAPDARCRIEDLLLAEPIDPAQLAEQLVTSSGPFRSSAVHPGELAAMIVVDAVAVALAKGYVSEAEGQQIVRFATALGCTIDDVRRMSEHLAPWLVGLR